MITNNTITVDCLPFYRRIVARELMPLVRNPVHFAEMLELKFFNAMENAYNHFLYQTIDEIRQEKDLDDGRVADALGLGTDAARVIRTRKRITVPNLIAFDVHFGDGRPLCPSRTSLHYEGYIAAITYAHDQLPKAAGRTWYGSLTKPGTPLTPEVFWTLYYSFSNIDLLNADASGNEELKSNAFQQIIVSKNYHISENYRSITDRKAILQILGEFGSAWIACMDVIHPGKPVAGARPSNDQQTTGEIVL
jgi:hypothetical protein